MKYFYVSFEKTLNSISSYRLTKKNLKLFVGSFVLFLFFSSDLHAQCTSTALNASPAIVQNNVSCKGSSTGSLELTTYASNFATYPFTFEWRSGSATGAVISSGTVASKGAAPVPANSGLISNLPAGIYVLVTCNSSNQQFQVNSYTITEPSTVFSPSMGTVTNPTCNGSSDGTASVNATGGTAPYDYQWSTGASGSSSISGLAGGNYSVVITDAAFCQATLNFSLTDPAAVNLPAPTTTPACSGTTSGSAIASASGGTSPYTYTWSTSANTTATESNLAAGAGYTVKATDTKGCSSSTQTFSISTAPNPSVTIASTTPSSCASNTGTATAADATGGTGPYTYAWTPGTQTGKNATGLGIQAYTVTATDANGCKGTAIATITYDPTTAPPVSINPSSASICTGSSTSLTASAPTATTPSYSWSPATGLSATNTASVTANPTANTTYTVTMTDAATSCQSTANVTVTVNSLPTVSITPSANSVCRNDLLTLTASGASTYSWTGPDLNATTGTSVTANPSTAGTATYTVTGTDGNGCQKTATVNITVNNIPDTKINGGAASVTICSGANTTLTATPAGATTYAWSPATGLSATNTASVTANPTATTTYTVTITGANGCSKSASITVNVNQTPTVSVNPPNVTICTGNSTSLTATSNPAGATFAWSPATGLSSTTTATVTANPTTTTTYSVTATLSGCTSAAATSTVTVTNTLPVTCSPANTNICTGGTGTTLTASGATTYSWAPATGLNIATGSSVTANPTTTTTYTVTGTTGVCSATANCTVNVTGALSPSVSPAAPEICSGSSVSLTASGGSTYSWSPATGLSATTGATVTANPTATTTYTVTATSGSCTANVSVTVTVNPLPTITNNLLAQEFCLGTTANLAVKNANTITASGGTAPLTYAWTANPADATISNTAILNPTASPTTSTTYTLTVTDSKNCQATTTTRLNSITLPTVSAGPDQAICSGASATVGGSPTASGGGVGATYTYSWTGGLSATANPAASPTTTTTYTVTVTTNKGCTGTDDVIVTVNSLPTVTINGSSSASAAVCNGSSVNLTAAGASSYAWSPATGLSATTGATVTASPTATTTYTVTGTGANSCTNTAQVTVTVNSLPVISDLSASTTTCSGTPLTLQVTNGVTYDWKVAGVTVGTTNPLTVSPASNTTYDVAVTDVNGCVGTASIPVTVTANPATVSLTANPASICISDPAPRKADFTVTGLNAGTTYSWTFGCGSPATSSASAPSVNFNACVAGSYSVDLIAYDPVTKCQNTINSTYNINPSVGAVSVTPSSASICLGNSVSLSASASSATNYTWKAAGVTVATGANVTLSPITTTTYTVIADNGACNASTTVTVTVTPAVTADAGSDKVLCYGDAVQIGGSPSASSGTPGYTYSWTGTPISSVNAANPFVNPTVTTTYTLTVTDSKGCTANDQVVVTVNPALSAFTVGNTTLCSGASKGLGGSPATASGGTAPYTYTWSPNNGSLDFNTIANPVASPTATTTYTVVVQDANNCQASASMVLTVLPAPTASVSGGASICYGASTILTASSTGGSAPVTYSWSPTTDLNPTTGLTVTANPTATTTYTFTATGNNGCSASANAIVTVNPQITITGTDQTLCYGNKVTIGGTISGGTAPLSYSWSPSGGLNATNIANPDANPTTTTTYTVTVTDANSCQQTKNIVVTVSDLMVLSMSSTSTTACLANDGTATVNVVSGGIAPFSYLWTPGGGTSASIGSLTAGAYSVTVTDAAGCTQTSSVGVSDGTFVVAATKNNDVSCNGGNNGDAIVNVVSGGVPNYTYNWTDGTTNYPVQNPTTLKAGTYTATVTDAVGCIGTDNITITEPSPISITVLGVANADCNGSATGSATINTSGGTGSHSYLWTTTAPGSIGAGATTNNASLLTAGTYTVTVTDDNGCSGSTSIVVTEPAPINGNAAVTDVTCNGAADGSVTLSPSGGLAPYTYNWIEFVNTTSSATNLGPGSYHVAITDANGCITPATVDITEPAVLTPGSLTTINTSCGLNTGSITANPTGGTSPYSYIWDTTPAQITQTASNLGVGFYTVIVTDKNNCTATASDSVRKVVTTVFTITKIKDVSCFGGNNGTATATASSGAAPYFYAWDGGVAVSTATISTLNKGYHYLQVTDNNGCVTKKDSILIAEPSALVIDTSSTLVSCSSANGTATVNVSGGTAPYTYSWNTTPVKNTASIVNLAPGTYTATVTDANGCTGKADAIVNSQPVLSVTPIIVSPTCNGSSDGSINLTIAGGVGPYSYSWNNGQTGNKLSGITAGTYTVTVTDSKGCSSVNNITVTEPAAITITASTNSPSTCTASDGSATVSAAGGTSPYSYDWGAGITGATISNVNAGIYTVNVTDANLCAATLAVGINNATGPVINSLNTTSVSCGATCDGTATVNVTGTAPLTYSWSGTTQTTTTATGLCSGVTVVAVTDANQCTTTQSATIATPAPLSINVAKTDITCNGANDGTVIATVTGGTGALNYSWTDGTTTYSGTTLNNLKTGTYVLTVTDALNCQATASTIINEPSGISISKTKTNPSCVGKTDGSINVTASGGSLPYTYSWNTAPVQTTANATGLTNGTYTLTITDNNGCRTNVTDSLSAPVAMTLTVTPVDATCNKSDGSATVNVSSGGSAPFSYSWSTGSAINTISNVPAGPYTVTVTDASGCSQTANANISNGGGAVFSMTTQDPSCPGTGDGAISISASLNADPSNKPPFIYSWTGPGFSSSTADISNLATGTYTVTVTDALGCITVKSGTLNNPSGMKLTASYTDVKCFGSTSGTATILATGGNTPYTYNWLNSSYSSIGTGKTVSSLGVGSYSVVVTDSKGCSDSSKVSISQPTDLLVSASATNALCNGSAEGSAVSTVSGGTSPYTYSWSPSGGTGSSAFGLSAGSYTLSVTDANGCSKTSSVTITEPAAIVANVTGVNPTCFASGNGSVSVAASGGVGSLTYNWNTSPASTTNSVSNLGTGNYTVVVKDATGCSVSKTVILTEPAALILTGSSPKDAACGASDGQAKVNVSGGTTPYTYQWDAAAANQVTATASNLAAGSYKVTVTDANSCSKSINVGVSNPGGPNVILTSQTSVSCFGGTCDGTADVVATGTDAPFTYSWNGGLPGSVTAATGLCPGGNVVTVSNSKGCITAFTVNIDEPSPLKLVTSVTDITCGGSADGTASVSVSGGTAPYTYSWNTTPAKNTSSITSLASGTYTVNVKDVNNCSAQSSVVVNPSSAFTATISVNGGGSSQCFGSCNNTAVVSVTGGKAPFTYRWDSNPAQTTATATGLCAGDYSVTITDASGCTVSANTTISNLPAITVTTTMVKKPTCNAADGILAVAYSGGKAPYAVTWNDLSKSQTDTIKNIPSGLYNVTVKDANGCSLNSGAALDNATVPVISGVTTIDASCKNTCDGSATVTATGTTTLAYTWNTIPAQTTSNASGLCAGTYYVSISDDNGCVTNSNAITISEPTLTATATVTNSNCNAGSDGTATVNVTGGKLPYTYLWSDAAAQTTQTATGLASGTYTVDATDANSCKTSATVTITSPSSISVSATGTDVTCFGYSDGSASTTVTGGTAPYSYSWSPSGGTGSSVFGLKPGSYTVTVTDANNCTGTATVTINQAKQIVPKVFILDSISCFGATDGKLIATATGGSGATYSYNWSTNPARNTQAVDNLASGNYTITVTVNDKNNCSAKTTFTLPEPAKLDLTTTSVPAACGTNTGSATVSVAGGTGPYTYAWTAPAGSGGVSTKTLTSVPAGAYDVTVTDSHGCQGTTSAGVSDIGGPAVTLITSKNVSCYGKCDGSATVSATGSGTITYSWNTTPAQTTAKASNLCATNNVVMVTDDKGCKTAFGVNITEPNPIRLNFTATDVKCSGNQDGSATVLVNGGTVPYSYTWNTTPAQNSATVTGLAAGSYTVSVSDSNGCVPDPSIINSVQIQEPTAISATISSTDPSCNGSTDGTATVTVSNGTLPYSYSWNTSPTQTGATATGLAAGSYTVTITDGNGCSNTQNVTLAAPAGFTVTPTVTAATCNGNGGGASVSVTGGSGTYSYVWNTSPVTTTNTIKNVPAGSYSVKVTDGNKCSQTVLIGINSAGGPTLDPLTKTDVSCISECNGSVSVNVNPSTSTYSYNWTKSAATGNAATGLCAGDYMVVVTDNATGCSTTSEMVTLTKPSINVFSSTSATCQNSTVDLNGTGPSYGTYTWSSTQGGTFNPATSTTGPQTVYTSAGSGTDNLKLTWTNATCTPFVISLPVNVKASPTASAVASAAIVCQGTAVDLSGSSSSGNAGEEIMWTTSNTNASGTVATGSFSDASAVGPIYYPALNELGTTTLTMTVDNGICKATSSTDITWTPNTQIKINTTNVQACKGSPVDLQASVSGGSSGIKWTTSNGAGLFTPDNAATTQYNPGTADTLSNTGFRVYIKLSASGSCGNNNSDTTSIYIKPNPTVNAGLPQSVNPGKAVNLAGTITGATDPVWSTADNCGTFENKFNLNTTFRPCVEDKRDSVVVLLTTTNGCKPVTGKVTIKINKVTFTDVITPSPLTPGYNDVFVLPGLPDNAHLVVYDRWGIKVFESYNYKNDWDGEGLLAGTYYYIVEIKNVAPYKGTVTIIRE